MTSASQAKSCCAYALTSLAFLAQFLPSCCVVKAEGLKTAMFHFPLTRS